MLPNNITVCDQINQTNDENYYDENYYDETYITGDEIYSILDLVIQDHIWEIEKIMLIFIAIFTVLGNTLVLVATWKEKSLHQPNKYFIASRAVADLLVGIFVAPLWLFRFYKTESDEPQHETIPFYHLCDFIIWIDGFALTASIYTLTFISYKRCLNMSKARCNRSQMTTFKSLKIIFIIWLISTVFASYAATPYSGSIGILFTADVCLFHISKNFYTFEAVNVLILPTAVMVIMYARTFLVAYIAKRQNISQNGTNGELGQSWNHPKKQIIFLRDLKVIRTLFVAVGVFIVCWGPYLIWILLKFYDPDVFDEDENSTSYWYSFLISRVVVFTLPLINSLCNPIIYACLDKKYKKACKHLFQQIMCRPISRKRQPPEVSTELRPSETTTLT
ncbi:5-hydroxytryptamine receptor 1-like [Paramuricea clavata]|uniref:5-hydroxytryptamine receptor 1-like n=1 Tax=Paramuricea clavata TaxID=317549 RepID=A0A7D9I185_PARCT|nr:5-hydroxytryptamine receptor 1-like [Paramuricea clavata]